MAFQNQNNKQNKSVNSRGFQFYNKDSVDPGTLIVSLWNQHVVLKMHPAKEPSKQTETSVYDYDKSINLVIPPVIMETIARTCFDKFIPALESGNEFTMGFVIGGNSALVISTGVKKYGKMSPYVAILRSIQQGTLKPEESMAYFFNPNVILPDYDGDNPNITPNAYFGEAVYFVHLLKHIAMAIVGVETHAQRVVQQQYQEQVFKLYKALAENIGASFYGESEKARSNYSANNQIWNARSSASGNTYSNNNIPNTSAADSVEVNSLDDLDSFM